MPEFKLNPPRKVVPKKHAEKKPRQDSYPRQRLRKPTDILTFTDGSPRLKSEAQVLAACTMEMRKHEGWRMQRGALIKRLPQLLDGVQDYSGYVHRLVKRGFLVTVGGAG